VAKRGFFAEIQYQSQQADKRRRQAASAAAKQQAAAERALASAQRAQAQMLRASAAEQKRAAAEAQKLHIEAMEAEAAAQSIQIAEDLEAIDSILEHSLSNAIAFDLESLRTVAKHPEFKAPEFESPTPPPVMVTARAEPEFTPPPAPTGLSATFGGKKRHAEEIARAREAFELDHEKWVAESAEIPTLQLEQMKEFQDAEELRLSKLADAKRTYEAECTQRDEEVAETNRELDELIQGIAKEDKQALQTYVSIVLGNSVFPDCYPVTYEFEYDGDLRELELSSTIPGPSQLPAIREMRYNKTKDEILPVALTQKQMKDRYAAALHAVALRTLHEVFEADSQGHIQTIALTVVTTDNDPATGLLTQIRLLAVAVDRETFNTYDLTKVVPLATLQHMKALLSKNPYELIPIDQSRGVRDRGN